VSANGVGADAAALVVLGAIGNLVAATVVLGALVDVAAAAVLLDTLAEEASIALASARLAVRADNALGILGAATLEALIVLGADRQLLASLAVALVASVARALDLAIGVVLAVGTDGAAEATVLVGSATTVVDVARGDLVALALVFLVGALREGVEGGTRVEETFVALAADLLLLQGALGILGAATVVFLAQVGGLDAAVGADTVEFGILGIAREAIAVARASSVVADGVGAAATVVGFAFVNIHAAAARLETAASVAVGAGAADHLAVLHGARHHGVAAIVGSGAEVSFTASVSVVALVAFLETEHAGQGEQGNEQNEFGVHV